MKLSQATKDAKERIKQSKKENKEMSNKKTIIATVAVTLVVVAAFAATFYLGTQYQQNQHDQIVSAKAEAVAEATQLKSQEQ